MFWADAELGSDVYLDGIVTLVDSKYGLKHLTEDPMALSMKPPGELLWQTRFSSIKQTWFQKRS